MRQVTGICCFVSFPVDAMDRRIVEFVFHLTPYMIENIFAFLRRAIRKLSLEGDTFGFAVFDLHLFQLATGYQEQVLTFLVGKHSSATDTFYQYFG